VLRSPLTALGRLPQSRNNVAMQSIILDLYIPADEYVRLYQGSARTVHARSRDGRTIQFPAMILRQFLTHEGIQGTFEIQFDANHKFSGVRRLG